MHATNMPDALWDAHAMVAYRTPAQRYSPSADKFATLTVNGDWYVMECGESRHCIARAATNTNRLAAHWRGFCETHGALANRMRAV